MPGKRTVVCFERACQEGVHSTYLNDIGTNVKTTFKPTILQIFCLILPDAQSTVHLQGEGTTGSRM